MKTPIRRPFIKSSPPAGSSPAAHGRPSWRHDLVVGLVSGAVVAAGSMLGQSALDDNRSTREERTENLRFVRERSSAEKEDRPFGAMDLREQNLSGLRMSGADLIQADLRNTNLNYIKLSEANLFASNLTGATLARSDLTQTDLSYTHMADVSLKEANLTSARLEGASFKNADLSGANLSYSILLDANFEGADFARANLTDVCYDESTTWPKDFTPPPPGNPKYCQRIYVQMVL